MFTNKTIKGPRFIKYFNPVLEALTNLGGSGQPSEVKDYIAEKLILSEQDLSEQISSGTSRFGKDVDWARFYLSKAGYIDASKRGVWNITDKGRNTTLTPQDALDLFNEVHKHFVLEREKKNVQKTNKTDINKVVEVLEPTSPEEIDHRTAVMNILHSLSAGGFERLSQRLLRESGFEKVTITGRSGDGGIDGIGVLQMNPFVSFKVLFQCKRYTGTVTVSQVRDFRGAMMGRTDKGIIITTGTFTVDAKKEAARDGVPPIELVDGEKLLDMFEQLELGLKPKKAYEIDTNFYEEYK